MHRVAICGCGAMSAEWIGHIKKRKDCHIVALVDVNQPSAAQRKEQYNLTAALYTDLKTAIAKERVNLVIDITPPAFHEKTVTTALKSGCHVFGEKPMSDTLRAAERMVACADATGQEYFVMQNRRYVPGLVALRDLVASDTLGNLGQLSADFYLCPHFGGFRDEMASPLIADMAIHTFDAARFVLNRQVKSVYAQEFNPSWSWYKGNASAICIFEMSDGTIFDYRGSWCTPGMLTSWESSWRASCSKGSALWDGGRKLVYQLEDGEMQKATLPKLQKQGHGGCIAELFDALNNGKRPQTDCRDNVWSITMVYKAIESAKTGKKIIFDI